MSRRKSTAAAAVVVIALLLFAGSAWAQMGMHNGNSSQSHNVRSPQHGQDGGNFLQNMLPLLQHLDLTDEQKSTVSGIVDNARTEIRTILASDDSQSMRQTFLEMFTSSDFSASEAQQLLDTRANMMMQVNEVIADALVQIHDTLTPEQLAMLGEIDPNSFLHSGQRAGMHSSQRGMRQTR